LKRVACLLATLLTSAAVHADDSSGGTPYVELRYRDSTLHSEQFQNTGHAHTLRLQLGYRWRWNDDWTAYLEGTGVGSLFGRQYNDTTGRRTPYPAEPDPGSKEISAAWLDYSTEHGRLRVGRQTLQFDDNRLFSINAWRQNPQSFDGIDAKVQVGADDSLEIGWFDRVNRTVGADFPDPAQRRWLLDAEILRWQHALPIGELAAYAYFMDNHTQPTHSVRTQGARWSGEADLGNNTHVAWNLSLAHQWDWANQPIHFDLPYHLAELRYGFRWLSLRVGEERLGGNGRQAFDISYGSGHSFDGWVGVFAIPPQGLRDRYAGPFGHWDAAGLDWQLIWHRFEPVLPGRGYGSEIDIGLRAPLGRGFSLELQYGDYRADSFSVSQRKLWLLAEYRYGKQP
jgi:hypothetical protein